MASACVIVTCFAGEAEDCFVELATGVVGGSWAAVCSEATPNHNITSAGAFLTRSPPQPYQIFFRESQGRRQAPEIRSPPPKLPSPQSPPEPAERIARCLLRCRVPSGLIRAKSPERSLGSAAAGPCKPPQRPCAGASRVREGFQRTPQLRCCWRPQSQSS